MVTSEGYSEIFVQSNEMNRSVGLEISQNETQHSLSPEQRLGKALDRIENLFNSRSIQNPVEAKNKLDMVVTNLDSLINNIKNVLFQVEQSNVEDDGLLG